MPGHQSRFCATAPGGWCRALGSRDQTPFTLCLQAPPCASASSAGTGRALPFTNSCQLMSHAVQPLPAASLSPMPRTVMGSPIRVLSNSQRAFDGDTLTHPCDTFRRPCEPTDHGAEWMYCPLQVMRWAYSISVRYPSSGPSSAVVSNTVDTFFSMTTMVPLDDGVLFLPRLTSSVRTVFPPGRTVIFLVLLSPFMMKLRPIWAVAPRSWSPSRPPPVGRPPTAMRTVSLVPVFQ